MNKLMEGCDVSEDQIISKEELKLLIKSIRTAEKRESVEVAKLIFKERLAALWFWSLATAVL